MDGIENRWFDFLYIEENGYIVFNENNEMSITVASTMYKYSGQILSLKANASTTDVPSLLKT